MPRNEWYIRDIDEATRRTIKAYAALNGISIAEALKRIVALAKV